MVNRVLKFTWDEWKWLGIMVMLAVVMYWTAVVVEPTYDILEQARETQHILEDNIMFALEQNQKIIDNQNNNTQKITDLVNHTRVILDNQLVLVKHLSNESDAVVLQGVDTKQILGNVTQIAKRLALQEPKINQTFINELIEKEMREWVAELKENLTKQS